MKHFRSFTPDQINKEEMGWAHGTPSQNKNTHTLQVGKHTGSLTYRT